MQNLTHRWRPERPPAELNLGVTLHRRGLISDAQQHLHQSLALLQTIGLRFRARALSELASIEIEKRNFSEARKLLDQAFQVENGLHETATLPRLLLIAGKLARTIGAFGDAAGQYGKALQIATSSGQAGVAALARLGLAEVDLDRKRYDVAEDNARQALAEFEREGRMIDAAYARAVAARCIAARGDKAGAARMLAPALQAAPKLEDPEAREYIRSVRAKL